MVVNMRMEFKENKLIDNKNGFNKIQFQLKIKT